eukprot:TRINITY_DN113602_c0_g1_i1.p1 TRINITY_DN113602_c0_g1~~TRINITY_DN113602_c0_g1_i1.p1  ORF type:complete len:356 (-),score=30.98 TRINITY_DN113602_c0_g1_i1:63-1130(-)
MMKLPEIEGPHLPGIEHGWPLGAALQRFQSTVEKLSAPGLDSQSLDIVLPHCREDLSWLADRSRLQFLPPKTRIFVYEKCGHKDMLAANLSQILEKHIEIVIIQLDDAADPHTGLAARRDECTAYLAHVLQQYGSDLADVTMFLHGDPADHTPYGLLNLLLRGLTLGTMNDLDFVHLGSPRLVQAWNPCQDGIFEAAIGRKRAKPLSTYCCSQFAVSKRRIQSRPYSEYIRIMSLVDGTIPDMCHRIGPSYEAYAGARLSHCYFLEFMWHVVFGENETLPLRADDTRLPIALRFKDLEENVPSTWKSYMSPYVGGHADFSRVPYEAWFQQIRQHTDIGRPVQAAWGDDVHDSKSE